MKRKNKIESTVNNLDIYEIITSETFIVNDGLISQLFVVTFVYSTYMKIVLIWNFLVQLSL